MNDLADYTLATTIAVVLLAITQIVFLLTVTVLCVKLLKLTKKADQTVSMSKDFVTGLRQ